MCHSGTVSPAGIVFIDIDGTLVPGSSSGSFLAQRLGHARVLDEAEARYAAGTLDNHEVCAIDARGWAGASEAEVEDWLEDLPLIAGIDLTLTWCRSHSLVPVLASLAGDPVGSHLERRFGFSDHCGPRLGATRGIYTGEVAQTFDEYDKRDFALSVGDQLGISLTRCIAIGDSRSDLPLFEAVGFSVAFNGSSDARAQATTTVDSGSVFDTVPPIKSWLMSAQSVTGRANKPRPAPTALCSECGFDHSLDRQRLPARCGSLPLAVERLLLSANPALLRKRPAPNTWSPVEYAAHIAEAVQWYVERIRRVLHEEHPQLSPFDFDGAAESGEYHRFAVDEVVAELRLACGTLADLTITLGSADLSRCGLGSDGSPRSVAMLLSRAEHELVHHHLDIRRALGATEAG